MNENTPSNTELIAEIEQLEEVYDTDYKVGQDNVTWLGLDLHSA